MSRFRAFTSAFITTACALSLVSCGKAKLEDPLPVAETDCASGQANIQVLDGQLERLCGCQETAGQFFDVSNPLTCTVSKGTVVFFQYLGTKLSHQIISVGTPNFPSSPLSDPSQGPQTIRVHAVTLSTAGTYAFTDSFGGMSGTLVVK